MGRPLEQRQGKSIERKNWRGRLCDTMGVQAVDARRSQSSERAFAYNLALRLILLLRHGDKQTHMGRAGTIAACRRFDLLIKTPIGFARPNRAQQTLYYMQPRSPKPPRLAQYSCVIYSQESVPLMETISLEVKVSTKNELVFAAHLQEN